MDRAAQRLQDQQQQEARDRAQSFDRAQQRPPSGAEIEDRQAAPVTKAQGCASIREVRLVGLTRYDVDDFADVLAPLKGDCTTIAAIDTALHTITDRYVKAGYVTSRAFVGPQDLKGGVLTVTVIEGRVGAVVSKSTPHYRKGEVAAAFPVSKDQVLNLRALEQGVDQLARLAGSDPTIDIAPGDVPASSTVLVKRKRQASWLRPAFSMTNDGSASTGRMQATATLDADSPLGLADLWSLYALRDANPDPLRGNEAYGGFVSLPRGWWTLSLSGGASDYHSVLSGNGLSFATRGTSWNSAATLDRMIHRDATTKLSLSAGLSIVNTANFIQGIQLQTGSYRITTATIAAHWQHRWGASLIAANLGYSRGLGILGAHTVDTGPGGATGRFNLMTFDANLQSRFALGPTKFTNLLLMRGQWGFDDLFPAQRFSLGGTSTVRGFRDDGLSGRSGALLRDQLGFGIVDLGKGHKDRATSLSGYLAYDIGAIRPNAYDPYERGVLQSGSVGLKAQGRHMQAELALSVPVTAPSWVLHKTNEILASMRIAL